MRFDNFAAARLFSSGLLSSGFVFPWTCFPVERRLGNSPRLKWAYSVTENAREWQSVECVLVLNDRVITKLFCGKKYFKQFG